jgi:alkyldihydroxyacetonephosphate synthase
MTGGLEMAEGDSAVWPDGERRHHRWGYTDSEFEVIDRDTVRFVGDRYPISGTTMPHFLRFAREVIGVDIDPRDTRPEREAPSVPEAKENRAFVKELFETFDASRHSFDDRERLIHSHGQTTSEDVFPALYGSIDRVVDLVVWCESHDEVLSLVELANKHNVCLVPYGGGTNVSAALVLPSDEKRMIVSVDLRRMKRLLHLDAENLTATFEAGIYGGDLENALHERGFTAGHEPDSIELSTLGGWIATYASGMKKNRYGNIEDIVLNATMVTPAGVVEHRRTFPRYSHGVRAISPLFGSEGNFGIITRATIRIHALPELQEYNSFLFPSVDAGLVFMNELAHSGGVPASVRLVDNEQFRFAQSLKGAPRGWKRVASRLQKLMITRVLRFDPHRMVVATIVMEGSREEVGFQKRVSTRIARRHRGFAAGPSNGRQGYMLTFAIAYIRDFMTAMHILGETFETTVPWSKVLSVTTAVGSRLSELCREHGVPGKPFLSYRITQLYQSGVCVYFTMGLYLKGFDDPAAVLAEIEHELRRTVIAEGGSLSHHHGVGKIRRDFLHEEMPEFAADSIRSLKRSYDSKNVFAIGNNVCASE